MYDKYVAEKSKEAMLYPDVESFMIFSYENSPIPGNNSMLNFFKGTEYPEVLGVHDDNEGFYVIKGEGKFKLGDEEFDIYPGVAMYAPAGVAHGIKKTSEQDLEIFLYHFK